MFKRTLCLIVATVAYGQSPPANAPAPPKQNVIERVSAATVFIRTDSGSGTGFIVNSDGTIVTASHVIADAKKVACKTGAGEVFDQVSLLARDERRDIAILKVPGFGLPTLEFGDLAQVEPGTQVYAIGNPLGLGDKDQKMTVTDGIVSGFRDFGWGYKILQISAPISAGNSGGPVVNHEGKVLGVAAFKLVAGENLNFATPIDYVRGLLGSAAHAKPLSSWDTPVNDSPFGSDEPGGLTDYWKSSMGSLFYVKDSGKELSIINVSAPAYTYDFRRAGDLIIGVAYGSEKLFCALKKIDDTHLHRVCFKYREGYDDARIIAEAEKRFSKPRDIWIRIR